MKQCLCKLDKMCVFGKVYVFAQLANTTSPENQYSTPVYMTAWNSPSSVDAQQVSGKTATHHHWLIYKHPQITCLIYYYYYLFFFSQMPPRVLTDLVVLPPGHGSSVTDF